MANIYVRSTDGDNADNGSTWALAKATLPGATAIDAAGDTIYVSQAHDGTIGANTTLTFEGTPASPTRLLCVNDAAEPPTTLVTGGSLTTTTINSNIFVNGSLYCYGIDFNCSSGSFTSSQINLATSATGDDVQFYENLNFRLLSASGTPTIQIGSLATNGQGKCSVTWKNVGLSFNASGQRIRLQSTFRWLGGSILSGSTAVTYLIASGNFGKSSPALIEGVNLENMGAAAHLVSGPNSYGRIVFANCKLPASWTGSLITGAIPPGLRAEMYNCDSADTNYRLWIEDLAGSIKSETTIVRTGGASDGVTPLSWKMASSASASYPIEPLESGEIARYNSVVGTPITATLEVITDGVTLKDDECWIEVKYLGTSGFPLGAFASDAKANVLATAANQTSSSVAWTTTGLTTPTKQKLSVTFTPQEVGYIVAVVHLAKPSTTVYVDPLLTVT